jgi:hypothetical protein
VESTVEHFYRAAAQGDGRGACGQLSPAARSAPGAAQCEVSIEQLGEIGGPEAKRRIASVDVIDTKVDGDTATTRAQIPGQTPGTLQLRRINGEWQARVARLAVRGLTRLASMRRRGGRAVECGGLENR